MTRFLIFGTLLTFWLAAALPANATPPRYASVLDTPIGVSKTHMFIFRVVGDNEGSNFIRAKRRFLVAQSLATGRTNTIWLLDETRETFNQTGEGSLSYRRASPKIDPLDIMADFAAQSLQVGDLTDWSSGQLAARRDVALSNEGILDLTQDPPTLAVPATTLRQRIEASLTPFMDFLPDDNKPVDPITFDGDAYTKDLTDCFVTAQVGNIPDYDIFRLECENGDFSVLSYVIYLTIPHVVQ